MVAQKNHILRDGNGNSSLLLSLSSSSSQTEEYQNNTNKKNTKTNSVVQWEQLNALTLAANDMQKSVAFYTALGLVVTYGGGPDDSFTTLEPPSSSSNRFNLAINLVYDPDYASSSATTISKKKNPWWGRCVIHVSDVDGMHDMAIQQGYTPEFSPRDAEWGERYFHMLDPSGHELSFAKRL